MQQTSIYPVFKQAMEYFVFERNRPKDRRVISEQLFIAVKSRRKVDEKETI